jgi:hypothetical protein
MGSLRDWRRDTTVIDKPFRITPSHRFNRHFQQFVKGAQRITGASEILSVEHCYGRDLARIVYTGLLGDKRVWCFVDLKNGDVLGVEFWKIPGTPRGNIFDEFNGLDRVGARGPF